jgi:signal recognition particle GTPase
VKPLVFDRLKQGLKSIVDKISKTDLSEKDLESLLLELKMQLIGNDVSVQVAEKVCEELKNRLIGQEVDRFGGKFGLVRSALKESIEAVMRTDNTINIVKEVAMLQKTSKRIGVTSNSHHKWRIPIVR